MRREVAVGSFGIALLGLFLLARALGAHWNLLLALAMVGLPFPLLRRVWWGYQGQLRPVWSRPVDPTRAATAVAWAALAVIGVAAVQLAIVPAQFAADELTQTRRMVWGMGLVWVALAAVPAPKPTRAGALAAAGLALLFGADLLREGRTPGPALQVQAPFEQPAFVFHGGNTPLFNHHAPIPAQQHALDLVLLHPSGRELDGPQDQLDSYACFGAPVLAPAAGRVVGVVADLPDQPIGGSDPEHLAGNHVVIQAGEQDYLLLAHLQQGSVRVAVGDTVAAGQPVGACGNSGNTSGPHLHLQRMNQPTLDNHDADAFAAPLAFDRVERGGEVLTTVPRRGDRILPAR